jgi:hypothetical protein
MKILKEYDKACLCQAETVEDYKQILHNIRYSWSYWRQQKATKLDYLVDKGQFFFPKKFCYKMGWI